MRCKNCNENCWRSGRQKNGVQRYYCKVCKIYQQAGYRYRACERSINDTITSLNNEGVGVMGISRILKIASGTVTRRIKAQGAKIEKPFDIGPQAVFEVDELWTYMGRKANEYWIACCLERRTKDVVDFVIGKRTKETLKKLIDRLLVYKPQRINTDNLTLYQRLIPPELHRRGAKCINHIERKNLSIRTHLKRLSRRTICFSRSKVMLESCLRIYFWASR